VEVLGGESEGGGWSDDEWMKRYERVEGIREMEESEEMER
jgi:hypothetical protein